MAFRAKRGIASPELLQLSRLVLVVRNLVLQKVVERLRIQLAQ